MMTDKSKRILSLGKLERQVECVQHRPYIHNVRIVLQHLQNRVTTKQIGGDDYNVPAHLTVKTAQTLLGYSLLRVNQLLVEMTLDGILTQTGGGCRNNPYLYSIAP